MNTMRILMGLLVASLSFSVLASNPKVAVTDLAYEESVKDYINIVNSNNKSNVNSNRNGDSRDYNKDSESSYNQVEGSYSYIKQTEMRNFSGDIKGELKKTALFDLIQVTPYDGDPDYDNIYDVIGRIDNGDFNGADYVLFGSISDIQFVDNVMNVQHTNTYSKSLGLTVVVDFSLVDTKTHEITAAFTAMGEAKEVRLVSNLDQKVTMNRAKLIRQVSKTLGVDVATQVSEQLLGELSEGIDKSKTRSNLPADEAAVIIKRK